MAWKRVRKVIKGICGNCAGLGWIVTPKGRRADCMECCGTGEKFINVTELVEDPEE